MLAPPGESGPRKANQAPYVPVLSDHLDGSMVET